jgi:glycosyltransferase involved in cell wall biosynthesis
MIDSGADRGLRASVRAELEVPENATLMLMVGELTSNKRHVDVLKALTHLDSNVFLAIAGSGPMETRICREAARLDVSGRVRLLGYREDVPALLAAADILVSASEREGLPQNVLEAQVSGVPVIGSDVRGTRDLLAGGAGFVFELGNVRQLAGSVRKLKEQPILVDKVITVARSRIVEEFAEEAILAKYMDLYRHVILTERRTGPLT